MALLEKSRESLKKGRFTEEQMVIILREAADWQPIAEVAKKHRVSDQTIYAWRKRVRDVGAR